MTSYAKTLGRAKRSPDHTKKSRSVAWARLRSPAAILLRLKAIHSQSEQTTFAWAGAGRLKSRAAAHCKALFVVAASGFSCAEFKTPSSQAEWRISLGNASRPLAADRSYARLPSGLVVSAFALA